MKKPFYYYGLFIAFILTVFGLGLFLGSDIYNKGPIGINSISGNNYKPAWNAIVAYIFLIISITTSIAGIIFSFIKVNILNKLSRIINLITSVSIFISGILIFFVPQVFTKVNNISTKNPSISFIISGIMLTLSGILNLIPVLFDNKQE